MIALLKPPIVVIEHLSAQKCGNSEQNIINLLKIQCKPLQQNSLQIQIVGVK